MSVILTSRHKNDLDIKKIFSKKAGRGGRHRRAGPSGGAAWSGRGRAGQGPHQAPHQGRMKYGHSFLDHSKLSN